MRKFFKDGRDEILRWWTEDYPNLESSTFVTTVASILFTLTFL